MRVFVSTTSGPPSGLLAGVALVGCAAAALAVAFTRLYAALLGPHLAVAATTLPLLGAGLGGVLLYAVPGLARPPALLARLAALTAWASGATVGAVILLLHMRPIRDLEPRSLLSLLLVYAASALPFACAAAALAAAVRHAPRHAPRISAAAAAGVAAGVAAGLAALRAGAPRVILGTAIAVAAAGAFFYAASRRQAGAAPRASLPAPERRASGALVATFVLGTSVLLAGDLGAPWLKLPKDRWAPTDKVEHSVWNEMALVTVDRPRSGAALVRLDGTFATSIADPDAAPSPQPDDMAYALHKGEGPVLVLAAGGGSDVRAALRAGHEEVHAVEVNRGVVRDVMRGKYAEFGGGVFDAPGVEVAVEGGRSFARRTPLRFRHVVIAMAETSAGPPGAIALADGSLFTVEAFRDYFDRLVPEGTLSVTRPDGELERLLALAAAGLRSAGEAAPDQHLFACSAAKSTAVVAKRTPLSRGEIDTLRRHCRKHRFTEVFAPDRPQSDFRRQLAKRSASRLAVDLAPPTDDRPYFFHTVPARALPALLRDVRALRAEHAGVFVPAALLALGAALSALLFVAQAAARPASLLRAPDRGARLRALLFFGFGGAGFALAETGLGQALAILLGHPARAHAAALMVLALAAAIGALRAGRVGEAAAARSAAARATALIALLVAAAIGAGALVRFGLGLPSGARVALAAALLSPIGWLMGSLAPLGVRLVAARAPAMIPWCFGLGGLAALCATAAGALIALHVGHSAALLAGALAWLLAAGSTPDLPAEGEVTPSIAPPPRPAPQ